MAERLDRGASRRDFLRLTAGAAAVAALGGACASGSDQTGAQPTASSATRGRSRLRIAQWSHFVPAYDAWFDAEYTKRWGEDHGVEVVVDHISIEEVPISAAAEVAAAKGHDIFGFLSPPSGFEDDVIDHREIVEEVEAKFGKMTPLLERAVFNPKTNRYYGFPDFWSPCPINYRTDLWRPFGRGPDTWEDIRTAGRGLKALGNPVGIGLSSSLDSNLSCLSLMSAYGSYLQDEEARVVINRPATVEAVKVGAAIYQEGMTDEVFSWDAASNNRFLAGGKGSLIHNPVSALRAIEKQDPELAGKVSFVPAPAGPVQRLGATSVTSICAIWKFAANQETARQFLADLAGGSRDAFLRSEFFNLPAFPGAVTDLGPLTASDPVAQPADKYSLLAEATTWSAGAGYPGYANAAVDEVLNEYLIPKMFAAAARGEMSAEESVKAAEAQIIPIFDRWRERGKI